VSEERLAGLQEALRREQGFARNVSHQLRTPLTGIRLLLEGALASGELGTETAEDLELAVAEVDRLAETVDALLAFSRGDPLGALRTLSPYELVSQAARRWEPRAAQSGRSVEADGTTEPLLLPVTALDQVLDVLVHNALRHGCGAVRLRCAVAGQDLELVVEDEGTVSEPDLLFARRRSGGGEGIGLSLARELAGVVGADLRLASQAPTAFALRLPAVAEAVADT
jgi:signal transduction histidine kinase